VGHILRQIVGCASFGDFDGARVSAATVESMTSEIVYVHAVDIEVVVVKSRNEYRCGNGPESVRSLDDVQLRIAPEIELHRGCARGLHAELRPPG
jgi:hypothetical protein